MSGSSSLRTRLFLSLSALVVAAAAGVGYLACASLRDLVERSARREMGLVAEARRQALIQLLTQQRARVASLLRSIRAGCAPADALCAQTALSEFLDTEGALAAELSYGAGAPIRAEPGAIETNAIAPLASPPPDPRQLARFEVNAGGDRWYVFAVREAFRDGEATLVVKSGMQAIGDIFSARSGLGPSGEALLVDAAASLFTQPRDRGYAGKDGPAQACVDGAEGETVHQGSRGVPVIRALRRAPEIGGVCVIALIDQAEALAPARTLAADVAKVSAALAGLAIFVAFLLAQAVSRPLAALRERARGLEQGDLDSPIPSEGPAEAQTFARAFEALAKSLKESRAALEASAGHLESLLENMREGFIAVDREWRCTAVNEFMATLTRTGRDAVGRSLWEAIPAIAGTSAEKALRRAMEERTPVHVEEFVPSLEPSFELAAFPAGEGLAIFCRDVTGQKRIAERLQQTQKLEGLGVLAGGIAHDFNNLLTGIVGNATLALEDLPSNHPARESLESVVKAGERAAVLTRQLLAYAGKHRVAVRALDISRVVQDIGSLLEVSVRRGVDLRLRLADGLPPVEGDATQIQQLVMNLVINAAEAAAETGGTVMVTAALQEVDEDYVRQALAPDEIAPGRYVALEVHDTGCGMDEDTKGRVFDPFFTTKAAGRGLGLAAALGIVRSHRGAMKVYSVPGKGTSFKVLLPVSEGGAPERREHRPELTAAG